MKTNKELLKRVREMETRFDEVYRLVAEIDSSISDYEDLKPEVEALRGYMESGQWKADFEADEAGAIPAEVKRGVLAEDGLYDLLKDVDEILKRARESFQTSTNS